MINKVSRPPVTGRGVSFHRFRGAWEKYVEGGALAELAGHRNVAATLFDYPINEGEPETGSATFTFCGKKGFEECL